MLRLRQEVFVHPDGCVPPSPMKRYPPGTSVDAIAESEGWQLCDDHFYDDSGGHPPAVFAYLKNARVSMAALGVEVGPVDDLIAYGEADEEAVSDAAG